jgi:hypothetical protein
MTGTARDVIADTNLSHGARLLYMVLLHAGPKPNRRRARSGNPAIRATAGATLGSARELGRPYLARRLAVSTRTVSRYVRELRDAGILTIIAPALTLTALGWRTLGVNRYLLHPPARHRARSRRDDTAATSLPTGSRAARPDATPPASPQHAETDESDGAAAPAGDMAAGLARVRAILAARRGDRPGRARR